MVYPMSEKEHQHVNALINKHWSNTKQYSTEDRATIRAMMVCHALAKHREDGAGEIEKLLNWMHSQ